MSQWQPPSDPNSFYFFADSKPEETVNPQEPDTIFTTAFFSTASSFKGAKNADLPWLKQYKESNSLEESIFIVRNLSKEILTGNFHDPHFWLLASKYSTIDRNGLNFLNGIAHEVGSVRIEGKYLWHGNNRFSLNKAKMLVWYNFCLCQMAVRLVDEVNRWGLPRGSILIDRLGDSDKRVMDFMKMVTFESSMHNLWKRCAEDHEKKPEWIGFQYVSTLNEEGEEIPPPNSMQFAVVDWIAHAAYAVYNGTQNRHPDFQAALEKFIRTLAKIGICKPILFKGSITWV